MPTVWFSLKRSLQCKSEASDVVDPTARSSSTQEQQLKNNNHLSTILTSRKAPRSGCSRSIANLKDVVIHGSKRHGLERPASCSPRSIGSSDFLNPIAHEVVLGGNSRCELKITGFAHHHHHHEDYVAGSTFVGTLRPGTPGPGGHLGLHYNPSPSFRGGAPSSTPPRKSPLFFGKRQGSTNSLSNAVFGNGGGGAAAVARASHEPPPPPPPAAAAAAAAVMSCHRCGEQFGKWGALEAHHLAKHAVTELVEGDSSRKIVEIICRTSWLKSESSCGGRIERVLKVHNMQKTVARFEEYREAVKARAGKLPKKHPRCLADGNELLRFYGASIACSLGTGGGSNSSLCVSERCSVCRIIRQGFSVRKGRVGVFTTSTSGRAIESIEEEEEAYDEDAEEEEEDTPTSSTRRRRRKALMVCRVIAGRVHKPLDNLQEMAGQSGFDSLAGKVGLYANIEELYLLNPRALLPCFLVICKP